MIDGLIHNGQAVVSVDEVARRKAVWASTVRKAIGRGDLRGVRIYGRWYIYEDSIAGYEPVEGRGNFART